MNLSWDLLAGLDVQFGDSFYLLDICRFKQNYNEFLNVLRSIYLNSSIGYSYKTNYTPILCKLVNSQGGYAEVVSHMEYKLAVLIGVAPEKIIFNGPFKRFNEMEGALVSGATVNIDSLYEVDSIKRIAHKNPDAALNIGIRCNFDIGNGTISRFGFDVDGEQFTEALKRLRSLSNVRIRGIHCHFSTPQRTIESYRLRAGKMLEVFEQSFSAAYPEFIDIGGGYFSKMPSALREQFAFDIPSYEEYADAIASQFRSKFTEGDGPELIVEPGAALVADVMRFVAKVVATKSIQTKKFAVVSGSVQNIKATTNEINLPIEVFGKTMQSTNNEVLDIVGYTCMEKDYLYKGYHGRLEVGDYIVFDNVGAYTNVLKPPFIQPSPAILVLDETENRFTLARRKETFLDVFNTYSI